MSPKEHEAQKFAKATADRLAELVGAQPHYRVALVAAPRFLGRLRKAISARVIERLAWVIDKDLAMLDVKVLEERLLGGSDYPVGPIG